MTTTTHGPALQKMLRAFPLAEHHPTSDWYTNEDNPRFDWIEREDGSIYIHSWTGRTEEEILALGGLQPDDIHPRGYFKAKVRPPIDLFAIAHEKRIDWKLLFSYGVQDGYLYHGRRLVKVTHYNADGTEANRVRVRVTLQGEPKYKWDENRPGALIPYGMHKLDMARLLAYLLIGEGESDAWACWAHDIPYLGIPGAAMQKTLTGIDLNDIPTIYILIEPDQHKQMLSSGQGFYKNIHHKLRQEGYKGNIFGINFEQATGYKDPSELHIHLWDTGRIEQFAARMEEARNKALPANDDFEKSDLTTVDKAIEAQNLADFIEHISIFAHHPRTTWMHYKPRVKKAFGNDISLNDVEVAIKDARAEITEEEGSGEQADMEHVATMFQQQYGDIWAYDVDSQCWRNWVGTHWREQDIREGTYEVDALLLPIIHETGHPINSNGLLACAHRLAEGKCKRSFVPPHNRVNFLNGTLEIPSLQLHPHNIDDGLIHCLDYAYLPEMPHPKIDAFLQSIYLKTDKDGEHTTDFHMVQAYEAHTGLALIGNTSLHQFLMQLGAARAGKSTAMRLSNATCGVKNEKGQTAEQKYGSFGGDDLFSGELEGKRSRFQRRNQRIVCCDELTPEVFKHEETMKNMSAHSGVPMRGMLRDDLTDNAWMPKLLLSTNNQPQYLDYSNAIKERVIYLKTPRKLAETERDLDLMESLIEELPGFAHTCIVLALKAIKRRGYPKSAYMKSIASALETSGNPLKAFVDEHCVLEKGSVIPSKMLYESFQRYRTENGHTRDYTAQTMTANLNNMHVGIHNNNGKASRLHDGTPRKCLFNIRLKQADEADTSEVVHEDDALLEPVVTIVCNACNQEVTDYGYKSDTHSNGATGQPTKASEESCNHVTDFSENASYGRPTPFPLQTGGEEIQGYLYKRVQIENTVTGLHGSIDKPVERHDGVTESEGGPLRPRYVDTTDGNGNVRDRENSRLVDKFLPIVLKRFEQQQIPWTLDNGVYHKGLISHEEFKHHVRASAHVGGDELSNVLQMLRTLARPMSTQEVR